MSQWENPDPLRDEAIDEAYRRTMERDIEPVERQGEAPTDAEWRVRYRDALLECGKVRTRLEAQLAQVMRERDELEEWGAKHLHITVGAFRKMRRALADQGASDA